MLTMLQVRGGLLCAKTGTGKTATAIALIYLQRCFEESGSIVKRRDPMPDDGLHMIKKRLPFVRYFVSLVCVQK